MKSIKKWINEPKITWETPDDWKTWTLKPDDFSKYKRAEDMALMYKYKKAIRRNRTIFFTPVTPSYLVAIILIIIALAREQHDAFYNVILGDTFVCSTLLWPIGYLFILQFCRGNLGEEDALLKMRMIVIEFTSKKFYDTKIKIVTLWRDPTSHYHLFIQKNINYVIWKLATTDPTGDKIEDSTKSPS